MIEPNAEEKNLIKEHKDIYSAAKSFSEKSGLLSSEDKKGKLNITSLLEDLEYFFSKNPNRSLADYLERVHQIIDAKQKEEGVRVMTIHSAKGLEFNYVYLLGVQEGFLPIGFEPHSEYKIEEERRLLFVAITRAKKRLVISYAKNGEGPSRYIKEFYARKN